MTILSNVSAHTLLSKTTLLANEERQALAEFLEHLAEIDMRKIHVDEGYSSLFTFLTHRLHMSESAAAKRVRAARLGRQHPQVLALLSTGGIHLSAASILFEHRGHHAFANLLQKSIHKSKKEIEAMLAQTFAKPGPIRESIRLIASPKMKPVAERPTISSFEFGTPGTGDTSFPEALSPPVDAIEGGNVESDDSYVARIAITISKTDLDRLNRLKQLSPGDSTAKIFADALAGLLEKRDPKVRLQKEKRSKAKETQSVAKPIKEKQVLVRKASRYIPKDTQRDVYRRDNGCCTFVATNGQRCMERGRLEYDHILPFALGGENSADNLRLRCKSHNLHHARSVFGEEFMQAKMSRLLS